MYGHLTVSLLDEVQVDRLLESGPSDLALGDFGELDCLVELRPEDSATGVQFRECLIDYTVCPNQRCIKKLL